MKEESSGLGSQVSKATPRQLVGIIAAVIILTGMNFVPPTEMLPMAAKKHIGCSDRSDPAAGM